MVYCSVPLCYIPKAVAILFTVGEPGDSEGYGKTNSWSQVCQVKVVSPLKSYCVTAEHVDTPNLS